MSNQEFVKNLAIEQRKRLVAGLMDHFEKKVAPALPVNVRSQALQDYRAKVLASVGAYHDFTLDCLKASVIDESVVLNEQGIQLLRDIHSRLAG